MLQAQQNQTQELAGNSNQIMNSQPQPGNSLGRIEKSDCGETIQTLELKNQMNQIQAVQQKVVADQAQLKATIQAGQSNLEIILPVKQRQYWTAILPTVPLWLL